VTTADADITFFHRNASARIELNIVNGRTLLSNDDAYRKVVLRDGNVTGHVGVVTIGHDFRV